MYGHVLLWYFLREGGGGGEGSGELFEIANILLDLWGYAPPPPRKLNSPVELPANIHVVCVMQLQYGSIKGSSSVFVERS